MDIYSYSYLILLLPALSFVILALAGMKMSHKTAGLIGTTSLGLVTVLSYMTAFAYFGADRLSDGTYATIVPYNFTWLPLGNLHFDMGILLDPISVMMLIVISTVSFMVHIYSFGYMHGEKGFQRYYAFLSLFTMSMLGLVLATNIFQMYTFWELVGVSSYLLIGFYYPLKPAIAASKKAFIVTRFADMFFLIGILMFGYYTDSFSFSFAGKREAERISIVAEHQDTDKEEHIGKARHDERLLRGGNGGLQRIVETNQQIGADTYQLPEGVHLEDVGSQHQAQHRHGEEAQESVVTLEALLTVHVAKRIDMYHKRHRRDDDEHHHRNGVQ